MASLRFAAVASLAALLPATQTLAETGGGNGPYVLVTNQGVKGGGSLDGLSANSLGAPSIATTLGFLHHGMPAWANLAGAEFRSDIPLFQVGLPTSVPSAILAAGTTVEFHCPALPGITVCDAWVFFYSCPQSCVGTYQGGVPALLAGAGWDYTLCAPHFVTGHATGYVHQMRSYRKQIPAGTSVDFTTGADAEFLAFGIDGSAVDCGAAFATEPTCLAPGNMGRCKWDGAACYNTDCRCASCRGPPPPCLECPWIPFANPPRPAQDGPF